MTDKKRSGDYYEAALNVYWHYTHKAMLDRKRTQYKLNNIILLNN